MTGSSASCSSDTKGLKNSLLFPAQAKARLGLSFALPVVLIQAAMAFA